MELELQQIVIRDEELVVFFPYDPFVEGELIVAPIHEFKNLEDLPDYLVEKIFHVIDKMSSSLFDVVGCQGTNLLIQNGEEAGQTSKSLFFRIIPRFEKDSLSLKWTPKPANPNDLDGVVSALKDFEDSLSKEKFFEEQKNKIQQENSLKENAEDYLIKSLKRNP